MSQIDLTNDNKQGPHTHARARRRRRPSHTKTNTRIIGKSEGETWKLEDGSSGLGLGFKVQGVEGGSGGRQKSLQCRRRTKRTNPDRSSIPAHPVLDSRVAHNLQPPTKKHAHLPGLRRSSCGRSRPRAQTTHSYRLILSAMAHGATRDDGGGRGGGTEEGQFKC